jgi:tRNA modification GTPase
MSAPRDTIVAIASGAARAGIGVVRIAGPAVPSIAPALIGALPEPRHARTCRVRDAHGGVIDRVIALYFAAPASYCGEHTLELSAHGNPLLLARIVARACELGARPARPGEFTERAFLAGKLDLAEAEAVADLIAASSEAQLRAARRSLAGEFSLRVDALLEQLIRLRLELEAAIDFAEEEIDFLGEDRIATELLALRLALDQLLAAARRGQRLRDGLHAVIIGRPNAGKSSLLNALAGQSRAIVTPIPGTTRDTLRESLSLDGAELTLVDTAGLRESADAIEAEGVARARAELAHADLALIVLDGSRSPEQLADDAHRLARECAAVPERLWLINKCDLLAHPLTPPAAIPAQDASLAISAHDGRGLDGLRAELARRAGSDAEAGTFSARARHVHALERVANHLARGATELAEQRAGELVAEELRLAQDALGEITGRYTPDDLLGRIFSSFCIGK